MSTMAANHTFARAVSRVTSTAPALRNIPIRASRSAQQFQKLGNRQYSSGARQGRSNRNVYIGGAAAAFAALTGGYYIARSRNVAPEIHLKKRSADETIGFFKPTAEDYQKVYNAIAKRIWDEDEYDDGSYGPILVRLSFHASGTYDAETGTGGSNGATMRFAPEKSHNANKGMENGREFLEPIKEQFPWISYSDLWTLAGVCAVQEMQGPVVPWRPGRQDRDESWCSPDGRLPDGSKGQNHVRAIFSRMGFNDQEIVALLGAHALGRCHPDRSGFDGPWTFSPTVLTNEYYRLLVEEKWRYRSWDGPTQYQDQTSKSLMMLPADMALVQDRDFRQYVVKYAQDAQAFFDDFSAVFCKLVELGVPFEEGSERLRFATFHDQEEGEEEEG